MKIISDIPPENVRKIQELVGKKSYKDIDEFVRIAVENQISLELGEKSSLNSNLGFSSGVIDISSIIGKVKIDESKSIIVEMPEPTFNDIKMPGVTEEKDMWIWGQINKILPLKFNIRYLFNLLKDGKESIGLEEFYRKASELGRDFGNAMLRVDEQQDRKRDERFSIGFPIGEEKSKSFSRFCSQFIGFKRADEVLVGALFVLKFANLKVDNKRLYLGITKSGLQFAKIRNPIFDENIFEKNLSEEEISFYLNHIIQKVPGEARTFYLILDLISKQVREGYDLTNKIRDTVPSSWTDEFINTQRIGAISRLYELGLITKVKSGKFVAFDISEKGKEYYEKLIQQKIKYANNT